MTRPAIRPRALAPGDSVAVLSPSWGGPAVFPHVFDHGIAVLRDWGLHVREFPSTRAQPGSPAGDPRARADDLNAAFGDPRVRAVLVSIGGDDAIRLLRWLDPDVISSNPKILMGFSDTTVLLAAVRRMGLVTFHGPSVMAGFAQMRALPPAYEAHVRSMLFDRRAQHTYVPYGGFVEAYREWSDPANVGQVGPFHPDPGPRVVQGTGTVRGELFGGCLEVLDWLRGTSAWPVDEEWAGRLLLLEPSEDKPSLEMWRRTLRTLGAMGVIDRLAGLLLGRARDHSYQEKRDLETTVRSVIADELDRPDLPILANLAFGHTDPQWVLPIGATAELDLERRTLTLLEYWLAE